MENVFYRAARKRTQPIRMTAAQRRALERVALWLDTPPEPVDLSVDAEVTRWGLAPTTATPCRPPAWALKMTR